MPPSRGMHYPAALLLLRAMGVHVGLLWTVRVGFAKHREDCSTRTVAPVLQNLHIDISWCQSSVHSQLQMLFGTASEERHSAAKLAAAE